MNANVKNLKVNIDRNWHTHFQKEETGKSSTPISFIQLNSNSLSAANDANCKQIYLSAEEKMRKMIVNKAVLRAIRRFYLKIFKNENKKLIKRRYTNVYFEEFVAALDKIIVYKVLPEIQSDVDYKKSKYSYELSELNHDPSWPSDLAIFLYRFIGFKSKDERKYSKDIELKGDLMQNWLYRYSNLKLDKLLDVLEFRALFQYVYYLHFDSMLEKDATLSSNREEYSKAFNWINNLIITKWISK